MTYWPENNLMTYSPQTVANDRETQQSLDTNGPAPLNREDEVQTHWGEDQIIVKGQPLTILFPEED